MSAAACVLSATKPNTCSPTRIRSGAWTTITVVMFQALEGTSAGEGLADWLTRHGVDQVDVVGIATDHCVRATALDSVGAGFATRVLLDLTAGVAQGTTDAALDQLRTAGVELSGQVHAPTQAQAPIPAS